MTKEGQDTPSSFLRTLSTAPEQPLQVMETLNLYWWSDMLEGRKDLTARQ